MGTPRNLRKPLLASVFACVALVSFPPLAQAGQESGALRAALRFWTPARMEHARPLSAQLPRPPAVSAGTASTDGGTPHQVPPGPPATATASSLSAEEPNFEVVPDPTAAGQSQNGAIFILLGHGEGVARCSGTSVNAPNMSVVFTAGHCVNDGGPHGRWFARQWVFVPGYHHGVRPFGIFVARWLGTTHLWLSDRSENADVGAAVVSRNEHGELLGRAAGSDGIAWGLPPSQLFDIYGYPVAPPFDGATQRRCSQTPFLGHDVDSFLWRGPLNMAVECEVTGGASGGGWVINGGLLNGVTDYGWGDDPATDFGSYFGSDVGDLYKRAAAIR